MNNKNRKTYMLLFMDPIRSDISWNDIEQMLLALGASISEGSGSRVRVGLYNERAVFHRPHPENVTDKGAVKALRKFLTNAGVTYHDL